MAAVSSGSFNTTKYEVRYLTFSWAVKSQSVSNNSTTISWTLKGAGGSTTSYYKAGNFKVVINGSTVYSSSTRIQLYNGTTVASGNFTIKHNSDGTKSFTASAEAGIYNAAVNCKGSGSWTLPTIERYALIQSAPDFDDTENPTITFTNPKNAKLQLKIETDGNTGLITRENVYTSPYTFVLTESERKLLRNQSPGSIKLTVRFTVGTYENGSIVWWSYLDRTMTITTGGPKISTFSYKDSNSVTTAVTGNDQIIIQNKSYLDFPVGTAIAQNGATIAEYDVEINGIKQASYTAGTFNFKTVDIAADTPAKLTVIDSRGLKSTKTITVHCVGYQEPAGTYTVQRKQNYYSETDIGVNVTYSDIDGKNTLTTQCRYKKTDETTYSDWVALTNNGTTTITLDNTEEWDLQLQAKDAFASATSDYKIPVGLPIVFFDRIKKSIGLNCFPKNSDTIEIDNEPVLTRGPYFWNISQSQTATLAASNSGQVYNFDLSGIDGMDDYTPICMQAATSNHSLATSIGAFSVDPVEKKATVSVTNRSTKSMSVTVTIVVLCVHKYLTGG